MVALHFQEKHVTRKTLNKARNQLKQIVRFILCWFSSFLATERNYISFEPQQVICNLKSKLITSPFRFRFLFPYYD